MTGLAAASVFTLVLAGCASEAGEPADSTTSAAPLLGATDPPNAPSAPSATPEPDAQVIVEVRIDGDDVTPAPGRTAVAVGQAVRIEVTGDQPDTVHVHGYDVEAELTPSAPAVLEFTADQPGLFEVETHESGLLLTQLVVE